MLPASRRVLKADSRRPLGRPTPAMRITWYGHAAFLIETQGLRIILDPYRSPDSGGYLPIDEPADIVDRQPRAGRLSQPHRPDRPPLPARQGARGPRGGAKSSRASGSRRCLSTSTPIASRRRRSRSSTSGRRTCTWSSSATLGMPSRKRRSLRFAGADIVLIPAGGPPTIDYPDIPPLIDMIGPRMVVPMHFKTRKINLNIKPVIKFLEVIPGDTVVRTGSSSIEVSRASLPQKREIHVLDYAK